MELRPFGEWEAILRRPEDMADYQNALMARMIHPIKTSSSKQVFDVFNIDIIKEPRVSLRAQQGFYPEYRWPLGTMPDLLFFSTSLIPTTPRRYVSWF
jgi:hypothetical protein